MNIARYIASHYFFSPYRKGFINLVTLISVVILVSAVTAMVVVMSVFNGFADRLREVHQSFDSEIKIIAKEGKSFEITDSLRKIITNTEGVAFLTEVIEDDIYLQYNGLQKLARFKGVTNNYYKQNQLASSIVDGSVRLMNDSLPHIVMGRGVLYSLGISLNNYFRPIELTYPKRKRKLVGTKSTNNISCTAGGVFEIERQYDDRYIFIPIKIAEELTDNQNRRSSLEIKSNESISSSSLIKSLKKKLGKKYTILSADEQHASLYKAIKIEKFFAFLVLAIILIVASVNLYIVVTMMIVSKQKDIKIMYAFGTTRRIIQQIFLYEGMYVAILGTIIGLLLGWLICWGQSKYGFVSIDTESALQENFPVVMKFWDFIYVGSVAMTLSFLIVLSPIWNIKDIQLKS